MRIAVDLGLEAVRHSYYFRFGPSVAYTVGILGHSVTAFGSQHLMQMSQKLVIVKALQATVQISRNHSM